MPKKKETGDKEKNVAGANGVEILSEMSEKLFKLMGISSDTEVVEDVENEAYLINVKGEKETGLLIGARGRTLVSIQMVLGLMYRQKVGEWKRIILNVSDYREKEEERLKDLARQTAERVKATGEPQNLYNLTPSQRRIVHMSLSAYPEVQTESQGEGQDRFMVVSLKK